MTITHHIPLVLASGSAIRAQMLKSCGLQFSVAPSNVDEQEIKAGFKHQDSAAGELAAALAKAKALRPEVEKLITKGKKGHLENYKELAEKAKGGDKEAAKEVARAVHLRRQVRSKLYDREVVTRVFDEIAPRYKDREGGYTRIIKYRNRRGDNAPLALIQLV